MFRDLRAFLKGVEGLGQIKRIESTDWDLEIGYISELQLSVPESSLLLFDKIKGYPPGYRVITNFLDKELFINLAFGFPLEARGMDLVRLWRDKFREGIKPIPPLEVETGPVLENVHMGDDVDLLEFPAPRWHELV